MVGQRRTGLRFVVLLLVMAWFQVGCTAMLASLNTMGPRNPPAQPVLASVPVVPSAPVPSPSTRVPVQGSVEQQWVGSATIAARDMVVVASLAGGQLGNWVQAGMVNHLIELRPGLVIDLGVAESVSSPTVDVEFGGGSLVNLAFGTATTVVDRATADSGVLGADQFRVPSVFRTVSELLPAATSGKVVTVLWAAREPRAMVFDGGNGISDAAMAEYRTSYSQYRVQTEGLIRQVQSQRAAYVEEYNKWMAERSSTETAARDEFVAASNALQSELQAGLERAVDPDDLLTSGQEFTVYHYTALLQFASAQTGGILARVVVSARGEDDAELRQMWMQSILETVE